MYARNSDCMHTVTYSRIQDNNKISTYFTASLNFPLCWNCIFFFIRVLTKCRILQMMVIYFLLNFKHIVNMSNVIKNELENISTICALTV